MHGFYKGLTPLAGSGLAKLGFYKGLRPSSGALDIYPNQLLAVYSNKNWELFTIVDKNFEYLSSRLQVKQVVLS